MDLADPKATALRAASRQGLIDIARKQWLNLQSYCSAFY